MNVGKAAVMELLRMCSMEQRVKVLRIPGDGVGFVEGGGMDLGDDMFVLRIAED
jgi:hypothetical protein